MPNRREQTVFVLTTTGAAATLVSIAAAQILLAAAMLGWLALRPARPAIPRYFLPLAVFMALTVMALAGSPEPEVGIPVVRKFVLFSFGVLGATFINSPRRARIAMMALLATAAVTAVVAVGQFGVAYAEFMETGALEDNPMITARITGLMSHWMTFSGLHLLVWCAALPALAALGRRWWIATGLVGVALLLGFTRSAWLGAAAGLVVAVALQPSRRLKPLIATMAVAAALASPLIYQRVAASFTLEEFGPDAGRLELWRTGLEMIADNPLAGVGPERISRAFPRYSQSVVLEGLQAKLDSGAIFYYGHLHNNLLQIGAERGLPALAAFLWFIVTVFATLWKRARAVEADCNWIAASGLAALTGFVIAGFFEYNFGDSEVLMLLLFLISMPYGATERRQMPDTVYAQTQS